MAARRSKKRPLPSPLAQRVRHAVALDAALVMSRLEQRADQVVGLFSRLRDRGPLLAITHSLGPTLAFPELAALEPPLQLVVLTFYEALARLRWYLTYTEDMPGQLSMNLVRHRRLLASAYAKLHAALGDAAFDELDPDIVDAAPE